jgi:hypothetical protein
MPARQVQKSRVFTSIQAYETVIAQLVHLHTYEQANEFVNKSDNITIFFSHQWLGWYAPDDDKNTHYTLMCAAASQIAKDAGMPEERVFIWADYTCVPQANNFTKLLAIETLHVYTSLCERFVIIAPPCSHMNSGDVCDESTYFSRGWCRLEQYSRILSGTAMSKVADIAICKSCDSLESCPDLQVQKALYVFEGDFTCCRLGHPNGMVCDKTRTVDIILGLFLVALETSKRVDKQRSSTRVDQSMFAAIKLHRDEMYPREYFGSLLDVADEISNEELALLPDNLRGTIGSQDMLSQEQEAGINKESD